MTGAAITMIRRGDGLYPSAPVFLDDMQGIAQGQEVTVTITVDRHPKQLAWYWSVLHAVCESGAWDGDKDSLDDFIRLGINWGSWRALSDGRAVFIPKSIALAKCDGQKFRRFIWYVERFMATRMGIDVGAVFAEADQQAGAIERESEAA